MSVGLSKLSYISLISINPRVKVNGSYYHYMLLSQLLLSAIHQVSDEFFIFQQDSAPVHGRARLSTSLIFLRDSCIHLDRFLIAQQPDLNSVEYKVWDIMQQRIYQTKMQDVDNFKQCMIDY